jgi:ketosteroid isomerase-like protein
MRRHPPGEWPSIPKEAPRTLYAADVASTDVSHTLNAIARSFLIEMQQCVRGVNYEQARPLFADDVVAFGTFAAVVEGRNRLENEQWRNVWPNISDFTFRLDELHALGTESWICVIVPWDSIGQRSTNGESFNRPGRATLVLNRRGDRWVATHSHFSLAPSPG